MVSNAFADRGFNVIASIDIDKNSNATIKQDIRKIDPSTLSDVADAIFASPDCSTYSRLGGNIHRVISKGEYAKSEKARLHDNIFCHMVGIMAFTKEKHPHCIFIIENPADGSLKDMPRKCLVCITAMNQTDFLTLFCAPLSLSSESNGKSFRDFLVNNRYDSLRYNLMSMLLSYYCMQREATRLLELTYVDVDYCTFGREEKKTTRLWTNSPGLADFLRCYRCSKDTCTQGLQHKEVRGNTGKIDFSAIPQPLAEEIALFVHSDLYANKRIQRTKAASPN